MSKIKVKFKTVKALRKWLANPVVKQGSLLDALLYGGIYGLKDEDFPKRGSQSKCFRDWDKGDYGEPYDDGWTTSNRR